jgi:hypothetical protein
MLVGNDLRRLDYNSCRLFFRIALAEGCEVVPANYQVSSLRHCFHIQPVLHPPDILFPKGRAPGRYLVKISAQDGIVTGMKPLSGCFDLQEIDVCRQSIVECMKNLLWSWDRPGSSAAGREPEVSDLSERMNARVSSACAADFNRPVEIIFSSFTQFAGDRARIGLFLPTTVARTVIFEGKFPGKHKTVGSWQLAVFFLYELPTAN